ncbi:MULTISPECIES: type II secretion system F family protein [unclassified Nocardioides]|uniref:type II secretion system F family protein n=1 Tax=unclassified Nocardioides TaxID=2615069 RepID=UPI0009F02F3D|nr:MULTISPECIES: type II secretion system F family protein [unclassified Nocardioides]GAW52482.1 type II secretion system protein [Nocardioides sp. PD653-B2]GAW54663.1 type II secretion system protein [Nocardioides sp. PD653]
MVLVLGVLLLAVAIVLLSVAVAEERDTRGVARSLALVRATSTAPELLTDEADSPFGERVLRPLRGRALRTGRRLAGSDAAERIRHRLDLAGNPAGWTVDRVLSGTVLGATAGLVVSGACALLLDPALPFAVLLVVAGAVLGFFSPGLYLYQRTYDRSERIRRDLPDAIDLLTISVEAGLGFDAAVQQVARNTEGPLADELARVLREMQLGQGRAAALRALAERTEVAELRGFVGAMVQADSLGIPIAQVLRVQSAEIRVKRRQRAEEKAQQVPVKMTVPLIFCILPCLFVVVLGPAVLNIMDTF